MSARWPIVALVVAAATAGCDGEDTSETGSMPAGKLPPAVLDVRGSVATCASLADGGVQCFGQKDLGFFFESPGGGLHSGPVYSAIGSAYYVECGIVEGSIDCWTLSDVSTDATPETRIVDQRPEGSDWVQVEVAMDKACALSSLGAIACWGYVGADGTLGFTPPTDGVWTDITMDEECALCALAVDGTVECFPPASQVKDGDCWLHPFEDETYSDIEANLGQLAGIRSDGRIDYRYFGFNAGFGTTEAGASYGGVSPWLHLTCGLTVAGSVDCWAPSPEVEDELPDTSGLDGVYTDLLFEEDIYVIDGEGQIHWTGDDTEDWFVSYWDAVGVANPDDR